VIIGLQRGREFYTPTAGSQADKCLPNRRRHPDRSKFSDLAIWIVQKTIYKALLTHVEPSETLRGTAHRITFWSALRRAATHLLSKYLADVNNFKINAFSIVRLRGQFAVGSICIACWKLQPEQLQRPGIQLRFHAMNYRAGEWTHGMLCSIRWLPVIH